MHQTIHIHPILGIFLVIGSYTFIEGYVVYTTLHLLLTVCARMDESEMFALIVVQCP